MHRVFMTLIAQTLKPLPSGLAPKGTLLLGSTAGPPALISTSSILPGLAYDRSRVSLKHTFRPTRRHSCPPCRSLSGSENVNAVSFQWETTRTAASSCLHFIENGFNSIESQLAARIETQSKKDGQGGLSTTNLSNERAGLELALGIQPIVSKTTRPVGNSRRPERRSLPAQWEADSAGGVLDEAKLTAIAAIPQSRRSDAVLLSEHGTVTAMGYDEISLSFTPSYLPLALRPATLSTLGDAFAAAFDLPAVTLHLQPQSAAAAETATATAEATAERKGGSACREAARGPVREVKGKNKSEECSVAADSKDQAPTSAPVQPDPIPEPGRKRVPYECLAVRGDGGVMPVTAFAREGKKRMGEPPIAASVDSVQPGPVATSTADAQRLVSSSPAVLLGRNSAASGTTQGPVNRRGIVRRMKGTPVPASVLPGAVAGSQGVASSLPAVLPSPDSAARGNRGGPGRSRERSNAVGIKVTVASPAKEAEGTRKIMPSSSVGGAEVTQPQQPSTSRAAGSAETGTSAAFTMATQVDYREALLEKVVRDNIASGRLRATSSARDDVTSGKIIRGELSSNDRSSSWNSNGDSNSSSKYSNSSSQYSNSSSQYSNSSSQYSNSSSSDHSSSWNGNGRSNCSSDSGNLSSCSSHSATHYSSCSSSNSSSRWEAGSAMRAEPPSHFARSLVEAMTQTAFGAHDSKQAGGVGGLQAGVATCSPAAVSRSLIQPHLTGSSKAAVLTTAAEDKPAIIADAAVGIASAVTGREIEEPVLLANTGGTAETLDGTSSGNPCQQVATVTVANAQANKQDTSVLDRSKGATAPAVRDDKPLAGAAAETLVGTSRLAHSGEDEGKEVSCSKGALEAQVLVKDRGIAPGVVEHHADRRHAQQLRQPAGASKKRITSLTVQEAMHELVSGFDAELFVPR